jgi:putative membrane protein
LVIGSFFFLLEKTARNLQDPFSNRPTDTAVTTIARNIEINIKQLIGDPNVPQPLQPEKFYIT